jgi:transposase
MESTGLYHFPLFCFLKELGFEVFVINPLITNSTKNSGIRKVKNDKKDAKRIAKLAYPVISRFPSFTMILLSICGA